jgi:glycosyltransferase involved in cell wall biosynthesis
MRRLRVLQIVASSHGGGAEVVRGLAQQLDPLRFEVAVALPDDRGQLGPGDLKRAGAECFLFNIASGFSLRELCGLRRLVRGGQWDIVHCHGSRGALWGRLAAAGPRRPGIVFGVHGLSIVHYKGLRRAFLLWLERLLRGMTDATLCDSDAERRDVVLHGIAWPERAFTVRSGIDVARLDGCTWNRSDARAALGVEPAEPLLATVCRLNKPRDFDTLLRAMRIAADALPAVTLLIVGGGPLDRRIDEQTRALGLEENVRRLGFVSDVGQVLAAADVFVLATRGWEGLPLAPLEAMVTRLPVVISNVGGNREAVLDGETGTVVPPGEPAALADAVLRILSDPAAARTMGEQGRRRVLEEFTAERMASETAAIYSRLGPRC